MGPTLHVWSPPPPCILTLSHLVYRLQQSTDTFCSWVIAMAAFPGETYSRIILQTEHLVVRFVPHWDPMKKKCTIRHRP